ncbi:MULTISPECIES: class I SAM-dependent methyltransferase [unclassified Isoptericola]|uniref:class I SAM-dependent methyltransferase n=1 Tax=unclassified Isoptericola TaxID=2623355 RepID=UPI002712698A|nr:MULTISPECIES: methyltransferase [unclassified Isoptericola]MDO8144637.1 methyltransferase [Isoptericola sp. 178]MDO8148483.1 methyltransferase [Isoptericola sp. b515]MDO8151962.1 methyltransferase [Isoptericola sp. b408]
MPPVSDHYFTARPASDDERRGVVVHLAGQDVTVEVAPGIFSPGGVDKGTRILLHELPPAPAGDLLDLGCGWGPITLTAALENPVTTVWAVDVNERALDLVRRNADRLGVADRVRAMAPDQVPDDVTFAAIWSNPPIRVGKQVLHDMLHRWLPRLASPSPPDGGAWLVVQKNLGADSLARWIETELGLATRRAASSKGFRILHVTR